MSNAYTCTEARWAHHIGTNTRLFLIFIFGTVKFKKKINIVYCMYVRITIPAKVAQGNVDWNEWI